jgi:hypothetical protein
MICTSKLAPARLNSVAPVSPTLEIHSTVDFGCPRTLFICISNSFFDNKYTMFLLRTATLI